MDNPVIQVQFRQSQIFAKSRLTLLRKQIFRHGY